MEHLEHVEFPQPRAADPKTLDFKSLSFKYTQTRSFIMYTSKNGVWDQGKLVSNPYIPMHIAACALHYGQAVFEGLKAFRAEDNSIRVFRPQENARRMIDSCKRLCMDFPSEELFMTAVERVVRDNEDYVPPYVSGGSLYLRPICFGHGAQIGVAPTTEYTFLILVTPVGAYYKGGLQGVRAQVITDFDRAAPRGTGAVKCAGNYAASLLPHVMSGKAGFPIELYLDAKTNSKVEEFSTSNFFGIRVVEKDGKKIVQYHTPCSPSILPSITNKTLREICEHYLNWEVCLEDVFINEIDQFSEIGATGTAVVVTPVKEVHYGQKLFKFAETVGEHTQKLYDTVQGIQYGRIADKFNWNWILPQKK
ncbi:Branched-chain_amino acid aminotransferase [Hexamita inflata]|uniref:Branched-chain amino acid aminotransferase n=1 Tax=Hexamita inflata TaxID=28002 RepID=A0AA86TGH6_9EUKA|nr:Branched-chain amino acid aminotransferase [Hexamita inflata]